MCHLSVLPQGILNLPAEKAEALGGEEPEHSTKDLYNAIDNGDFPSWTCYIQVSVLTVCNPNVAGFVYRIPFLERDAMMVLLPSL